MLPNTPHRAFVFFLIAAVLAIPLSMLKALMQDGSPPLLRADEPIGAVSRTGGEPPLLAARHTFDAPRRRAAAPIAPAEPQPVRFGGGQVMLLQVAQLADDQTRFNADRAMRDLRAQGPRAVADLERALRSADRQQRQLAAAVLRTIDAYRPSDAMLKVCVEGLRHDVLPYDRARHRYNTVYNAADGVRYLLRHAEAARRELIAALGGTDWQQRFLAAYVLGATGRGAAVNRAAPILIAQLRDNDVPGDALMAAEALYGFGPAVEPTLRRSRPLAADDQQARLIDLILLNLADPPKNQSQLRARKPLHNVTTLHHDPVIEHRFRGIQWQTGDPRAAHHQAG